MKLWVDDERVAPPGWKLARTADEAIRILVEGDVEEVSLDHDLGEEGNGYDVLLWIEEKVFTDPAYSAPQLRIHTANISARKKMELAVEAIENEYRSRGRSAFETRSDENRWL